MPRPSRPNIQAQQPALAPLSIQPADKDTARQEASDERIAALLLSEAREELEIGELRNARRRLEVLVTRFATTSVGARARRLLEQLALIDGVPMPPMPKGVVSIDADRGNGPGAGANRRADARLGPARDRLQRQRRRSDILSPTAATTSAGAVAACLREKAAWLQRYPQVFLRIEGYADDAGNDETNSAVALRRAEAVRDVLIEAGSVPDANAYHRVSAVNSCCRPARRQNAPPRTDALYWC